MIYQQNHGFWMDVLPLLVQTAVIYGILMLGFKTAGPRIAARFAPADLIVMFLIVEMAAVQIAFIN